MHTIKEFQSIFKPNDDASFKKLIHEPSTLKQRKFLKQLCEALGHSYIRPTSLQTASKQIDRLVKEAKNLLAVELLFADAIEDRLEDLDYSYRNDVCL